MVRATLVVVLLSLGIVGCKGDKGSPLKDLAKAAAEHGEFAPAIPILSVNQLRASQAYFRDVLGFTIAWDHGNPPSFGAVTRGDATLFICQGCQGRPGSWVMVFTRDVDALYAELKAKRALIKMPPTTMPWELRELHVADPDGNVIRFASREH